MCQGMDSWETVTAYFLGVCLPILGCSLKLDREGLNSLQIKEIEQSNPCLKQVHFVWFVTLQSFWWLVFNCKDLFQQANFWKRNSGEQYDPTSELWIQFLTLYRLSYFRWFEKDLTHIFTLPEKAQYLAALNMF